MKGFLMAGAIALAVTGCANAPQHYPQNFNPRAQIAHETCESQADIQKAEYLAAVEDLLSTAAPPAPGIAAVAAPLERFRAEINSAHRTVVMRCKTHMQCLEIRGYDEAKCYMAASDRKDAERRFADLSYQLRDLEREIELAAMASSSDININTNISQHNKNKNKNNQKNETDVDQDVGDEIEIDDVDVLMKVCSSEEGLLDSRCIRFRCENYGRCE